MSEWAGQGHMGFMVCCSTSCSDVQSCLGVWLQVWVVPRLADDGRIYWKAYSDSQLTKVSQHY